METTTWIPQKEIGAFILWSNEAKGSLLKYTFTKQGSKIGPEGNDQFYYSRKACENAIEDSLIAMIKKQLRVEAMLTSRQAAQLVKRVKNRNLEKK